MYTVNGVELDNETYGWSLLRASQMLTGVTKNLNSTTVPWRNGVIPKIPASRGGVTTVIVVKTSGTNLDRLYRLFSINGGVGTLELTADNTRYALFELASIDSAGRTAEDESVVVTITVRIPTADWRSVAETVVAPATVADSPHAFTLLPGISAEVFDADIFVGGNFGTFQLVDSSTGSWLATRVAWPYVSGTGLLYQGATGRAFRSLVSDPWTPGADMSGYIDVSGGGGFRITPDDTAGIDSPHASLSLTTGSRTSLTFGFRAYNAFLLRNGDL